MKELQQVAERARKLFTFAEFLEVTFSEFENLDVVGQVVTALSYLSFSQYFQFKGNVVVAFEHTPFALFCENTTAKNLPSESEVVDYYRQMVYSRPELLKYKMFQQNLEELVSE